MSGLIDILQDSLNNTLKPLFKDEAKIQLKLGEITSHPTWFAVRVHWKLYAKPIRASRDYISAKKSIMYQSTNDAFNEADVLADSYLKSAGSKKKLENDAAESETLHFGESNRRFGRLDKSIQGGCECETCNGRGEHTCRSCQGDPKKACSDCYYASAPRGQKEVTCSSCYGQGYYLRNNDPRNEKEHCYSCGGRGKSYAICSTCSGSGEVICNTCSGSGMTTCNECNGYGAFLETYIVEVGASAIYEAAYSQSASPELRQYTHSLLVKDGMREHVLSLGAVASKEISTTGDGIIITVKFDTTEYASSTDGNKTVHFGGNPIIHTTSLGGVVQHILDTRISTLSDGSTNESDLKRLLEQPVCQIILSCDTDQAKLPYMITTGLDEQYAGVFIKTLRDFSASFSSHRTWKFLLSSAFGSALLTGVGLICVAVWIGLNPNIPLPALLTLEDLFSTAKFYVSSMKPYFTTAFGLSILASMAILRIYGVRYKTKKMLIIMALLPAVAISIYVTYVANALQNIPSIYYWSLEPANITATTLWNGLQNLRIDTAAVMYPAALMLTTLILAPISRWRTKIILEKLGGHGLSKWFSQKI